MKFTIEGSNELNKIIKYNSPLLFKVKGQTLESIINSKKEKSENIILGDIIAQTENNRVIKVLDRLYGKLLTFIFNPPIKVIYEKVLDKVTLTDENVYSLFQIDDLLENYKIKKVYFKYQGEKLLNYFDNKIFLNLNEDNNELILINGNKKYELKKNSTILTQSTFTKILLSKYFDKYFIYPEKEEDFQFFTSENRRNLLFNIQILINNNSSIKPITKFKISGPSSEGKSITLLYASRLCQNIIYLNLKTLIKLYMANKIDEYLDILIYEFGRLDFNNNYENYKKEFETKFNENTDKSPWELLMNLSDFLKDKGVILILDQFKEKYVSTTNFEVIKSKLNSSFKIIISSSINDKDIGEKVSASIYKYKGTPKTLDFENQDDYFYYIDLINKNDLTECFVKNKTKTEIEKIKLFNFEPKYIKLLNAKTEEDISNHIIKKMEEHSAKLGIELNFYIFNIYSKIGTQINYEILNIKTLSLKYCKLMFEKETFSIQYKFQFIENIVNKKIKEIDTQDYFIKKKYKENELYNELKGKFFEYSSILDINKKKIFFKDNPIQIILPVKTIIGMEQCEDNETVSKYKRICSVKYEELIKQKLNLINDEISNNSKMDIIDEVINNNNNDINNTSPEDNNSSFKNIQYYYNENLKREKKRLNDILLGKKRGEEDQEKEKKKEKENEKEKKENKNKKSKEKKVKKEVEKENEIKTNLTIDLDESVDNIQFEEEFKNSSILITQKQITGKTLDLGFLCGNKEEKKFIGLQMKFYDKNSRLKKPITKDLIKESIQSILINCLEKFGMKIIEWHYAMCLYYNKDEEEEEYNKYLINNCNHNNIEYIFFNPSENKFYNRNKFPLDNFDTTFLTNIDFDSKCNPYKIFVETPFLTNYLYQTEDKSLITVDNNDIFNNKNTEVIASLKNYLKDKEIKDIQIICKFQLVEEYHFPIPNNLYCLLFQTIDNNLLYYFNIDNELKCKDTNIIRTIVPSFISNYILDSKKRRKKEKIYFYVLQMIK